MKTGALLVNCNTCGELFKTVQSRVKIGKAHIHKNWTIRWSKRSV